MDNVEKKLRMETTAIKTLVKKEVEVEKECMKQEVSKSTKSFEILGKTLLEEIIKV